MNIYCDLDGVLVDLASSLGSIIGVNLLANDNFEKYFYDYIKTLDKKQTVEFWSNLPRTKDSKLLWDAIKEYKPFILTSCSGSVQAYIGKINWCKKHLGIPRWRVLGVSHSNRKKYYACEHNILIDDLSMNINQWREKKGIGILHKNAQETIQQLNAIKQQKGCC